MAKQIDRATVYAGVIDECIKAVDAGDGVEMVAEMDKEFIKAGMAASKAVRAVTQLILLAPPMSIHTPYYDVNVDDFSATVTFRNPHRVDGGEAGGEAG